MYLAVIQPGDMVTVKSDFQAVEEEDPEDNMVLDSAYDGNVDMIVIGDEHLLALGTFRGIRILRISEALQQL